MAGSGLGTSVAAQQRLGSLQGWSFVTDSTFVIHKLRIPSERVLKVHAIRKCIEQLGRRGGWTWRGEASGQSVVEFALIIPILLMVFVAIADFGRIFAASIAIEAATRNAAEATANRYVAQPPGGLSLDQPAPAADAAYYNDLHDYAAGVVCAELRDLPSTNYDSGTNSCPDMPVVFVCVHDGQDPACGTKSSPGGSVPGGCDQLAPAPTNSQAGTDSRWVEVRTCSRFTAILNLPLFSFGDFWLQHVNHFTIPCYFALGTADPCG